MTESVSSPVYACENARYGRVNCPARFAVGNRVMSIFHSPNERNHQTLKLNNNLAVVTLSDVFSFCLLFWHVMLGNC